MPEVGKKNCKYCQTEISAKAKVCPNCRRKLKPNGCLTAIGGFFILMIVIGVIGSLGGNSSTPKETAPADTSVTENTNSSAVSTAPATRDNSSAKETDLGTGSFIVGTDIPAGRYVCSSKSSGNFIVQDGQMPVVNEILGGGDFGVDSVTVDLLNNQVINISGMPNVNFKPAETALRTELTTGEWVVGLDIEPGRYICEPLEGSGNFNVYDGSFPTVNEILGSASGFGVPSVTATLKEGNVVKISGLKTVKFTAK